MKTLKIVLRSLSVISIVFLAFALFSSGRLYEDLLKEGSLKNDFTTVNLAEYARECAPMFFTAMIKFLLAGLLLRLAIIFMEKNGVNVKNITKVLIAGAAIILGLAMILIKLYKLGELGQITVIVAIMFLGFLTVTIGLWPNLSVRFFNWITARPKLVLEENNQENS